MTTKPTSFAFRCLSVFIGMAIPGATVRATTNASSPLPSILLPAANAKTVLQQVEAVRKGGGVVVQGTITMPQGTKFLVSFYPDPKKPKEFGQSTITVGRSGEFTTAAFFTNRTLKPGSYKVEFHSGILMQGIQPEEVLSVIGPLGEKLPRSVVQSAGKPFSKGHVMIVETRKLHLP